MEKKSFFKRVFLGFLIGIAVIVPGISGSTIAILFKLYKKILSAISNIFKEFKKSIKFLLPIALGGALGFVGGLFAVKKLIDIIPFSIAALFAGLMLGGIPGLFDEVRDVKPTKRHVFGIIIAFFVPLIIASLSVFFINHDKNNLALSAPSIFIFIGLGIVVALTQFIPGASASATLMGFGYYIPLMKSLSFTYIKNDPSVIVVYLLLIAGALLGAFASAKLLDMLTNKFKGLMYFIFIGLSLGSIVCIFYNADMIKVYKEWANGNSFPYLDVFLGIGLFILGVALSYLMVLYTRKKNKEKNKKASLSIKDLCNTYATATFEDFEFVAEIECVDNKTKEDEKVL